jgi:hypothetical protein
MREAERCGVKRELGQYLRLEGAFGTANSRKSGLVATNFFIPTLDMLKFRNEAETEGAKQQIWSLRPTPGIDLWFRDWATPKPHRGRRHLVPIDAQVAEARGNNLVSSGAQPKESGAAKEPTAPRETRKKRSRDKHLRWKALRDAGKSYGEIAQIHRQETGENVSREAVILALKRLGDGC